MRPSFEHDDAVGEHHRLLAIVGDVDGGDAEARLHRPDLAAQLDADARVEIGQRLVEEQHAGSMASARPSATRWRWPPESWVTLRSPSPSRWSSASSPSILAAISAARAAAQPQAIGHVLEDRHVRPQGVGLEHHGGVRAFPASSVMSLPARRMLPAAGVMKPEMVRSSVVLPQPELPRSATKLPASTPSEMPRRTSTIRSER